MPEPVAVYVHTPFCPSKCGYCDFNSYAMSGEIIDRTVDAIESEIRNSIHKGRQAKTVFFGGGTPTFLSEEQISRLVTAVLETHPPISDCEVTSEANPGTVDIPKFKGMRQAGFNRISLGAQSFNTSDLIQLGRVHDAGQVGRAIESAREAGFDNINIDLMFALPGQSERGWENNLRLATSLGTEHLSLYCLTIEQNTRFYKLHLKGMLDLPDEESQVRMYDLACEVCESNGYQQYEISNFAKPGRECKHNICYWEGEEYLGYGPGAVGCAETQNGRVRYVNLKHPEGYCKAVSEGNSLWCEQEPVDNSTLRTERIMLGIRLNKGISKEFLKLDPGILDSLGKRGWTQDQGSRVALTAEGRHYCSEVALALV